MQRRRFIKILASGAVGMNLSRMASATSSLQPVRWSGYTLGAKGSFTLYTDNPSAARAVLRTCFAEIKRLESLFSLYDHQSELCQLNRQGYLKQPSQDWLSLLSSINQAHAQTAGLFDPTIQPLWQTYSEHFRQHPNSTAIESMKIQRALAHTGWHAVNYDRREIRFDHPKMALTLNGIAQGAITDRVSELLKDAGYTNVLVELGETRAIGAHPEKRPWSIGIQDARQPDQLDQIAELDNQALATSGSYGSTFSQDGAYHHLIHPTTGLPGSTWKSLSVIAPTATEADALSTGLSFASKQAIQQLTQQRTDLTIFKQA